MKDDKFLPVIFGLNAAGYRPGYIRDYFDCGLDAGPGTLCNHLADVDGPMRLILKRLRER